MITIFVMFFIIGLILILFNSEINKRDDIIIELKNKLLNYEIIRCEDEIISDLEIDENK